MAVSTCSHVSATIAKLKTAGCEECMALGETWVHLRLCLHCGHVGCCDTSKNKHATRHFQATGHAVMSSLEHREHWMWCYVHERLVGRAS
jgi:uncharacterized UBP type Zn finger protein